MSILIENLSKKFGDKVVLDNINLEIKTGSLVALLGSSGSGKSTLLRVVAGFEKPDIGRVWFHGKDSSNLSVQEKEIGFVFQAYALFKHLTVYENIAFGTSINKDPFYFVIYNNFAEKFLKQVVQISSNLINNTEKSNLRGFLENLDLNLSDNFIYKKLKHQFQKNKNLPEKNFIETKFKPEPSSKAFLEKNNQNNMDFKVKEFSDNNNTNNSDKQVNDKNIDQNLVNADSLIQEHSNKDSLTVPLKTVEELLGIVNLSEFANRYPPMLSGGQCQRVALARALAVQPKVLLLDEPFGALDMKVRKKLRRWIRQLQEKVGVTTLFVTHDYEEAMEVANEIVVLENGRVKYSLQSPKKIFNRLNSLSSSREPRQKK